MSKKANLKFDESAFKIASRSRANAKTREFAFGKKNSAEKTKEHGFATAGKATAESTRAQPEKSARNANGSEAQAASAKLNAPEFAVAQPLPVADAAAEPRKNKRRIELWLARRGHSLTFALLFSFTVVLYFRPYELIPALSGLSSLAWFLAIGTILIFVPSQLAAENSFTARPAEVNYILLFALFGLISIVVARDHTIAWSEFNDPFVKVVLIFIVMVNAIRTKKRLLAMMSLSLAVGVMLAIEVLQNYSSGKLTVEGYRTMAEIKGVFGNPNAQSLHFIMMLPIAVALGLATKNFVLRLIFFAAAALFVAANMLTFSRGGFLGLIVASLVLAWKLGRKNRLAVMAACAVIGILVTVLAPGGYGIRVLSIFVPGLDPVGSSHQRSDLLKTSILVTARNPWGIGMGNFPLANPVGLVTHNSYTQVSSEMGVIALVIYLLFHFEPIRRLFWIERELSEKNDHDWFYFLSIGLQASFAAWCVGSFFDAAAYQWFLYYLAAYAICLRRVYQIGRESGESRVESRETKRFLGFGSRLSTLDS